MSLIPVTTDESEGPARLWRRIQRRAHMKARGESCAVLPIPVEDSDIESFYDVMSDHSIPLEISEQAFPDHYRAMRWYLTTSPSSPRWLLEAFLLTGRTIDDILSSTGLARWSLSVDIYKRAFFDVTPDQLNSPTWMNTHIWVPGSMHTTNLYYYDYILKLAAVSRPELILTLASPKQLPTDALKWLRMTVEDRRDRVALAAGNIAAKAPVETQVVMNENTYRGWREDRESEGLAAQDSEALRELMGVVERYVGIPRHDETLPETQEFQSEKYSDEDIIK